MKISIITFHNTMNIGATLQCVSLSTFLSSLGYDVEVVNYMPYYIMDKRSPFKELKKIHNLKSLIKGIAYLINCRHIIDRNRKYDAFIDNNISLTRLYKSNNDLCSDPPCADIYICGSDQIWNPSLTGNAFDESFFLRFVDRDAVKIAYGVSVGELNIESNSDVLKVYTEDFDRISVREKSSAERLSSILERDISVVLDPTLLLDKEKFYSLEKDFHLNTDKFLLLYTIQNSEVAINAAKKIALKNKLEIIDISPNPFQKEKNTIRLLDIGPGEFLWLFKNAECVITNSFHGTAFSIIYEKNFNSVLHTTRGGRIRDLLQSLDLTDRIITNVNSINQNDIDYTNIRQKLLHLREKSEQFIQEQLINE